MEFCHFRRVPLELVSGYPLTGDRICRRGVMSFVLLSRLRRLYGDLRKPLTNLDNAAISDGSPAEIEASETRKRA